MNRYWLSKASGRQSAYAQKHAIEAYHRAEQARRRAIHESIEAWGDYVRVQREADARTIRKGLPAPTTLPHPDDVVLDSERGVRFTGPYDEASAERLRISLAMRDVLTVQDALQLRMNDPLPDHKGSTALVGAMRLDQSVPQRYRLS